MKRGRLVLGFFILLITMISVGSVSAFFTPSHLYWTLKGMDEVNSPITEQCRPYIDLVLDGNTAADVPVIHYFDDDKVSSYISTHTKGAGFNKCMAVAGTDKELQCMCYGVGLHIIQDRYAHLRDGLVPRYLEKSAALNLFGHMVIEKDYEVKHLKVLEERNDDIVRDGRLDYYNEHILCSFMEPSEVCPDAPGDYKYLSAMKDMSGIDMRADINLFQTSYLGVGFYDTVYEKKINPMAALPWFFGVVWAMLIVGFAVGVLTIMYGKTTWKWSLAITYFIVGLAGCGILVAYYTNNIWDVTEVFIQVPTKVGLMTVTDVDVEEYDRLAQLDTNRFLETGILPYEDVSGLSYRASDGTWVDGALNEAESVAKFLIVPLISLIFLAWNVYTFRKVWF